MRANLRWILPMLLLLPVAGCASKPVREPALNKGEVPPARGEALAFSLPDAKGRIWTLEDTKAKPVLIDFWATWCRPCLDALPELNNFHKKHQAKIQILGLNIDIQGMSVAGPMAERYGLLYPVIIAPPKLSKDYGAKGYPFLALVFKGKIVKTLSGNHRLKDLEKELAPWLK